MNIEIEADGLAPTRELQHFARCRADYAPGALLSVTLFVAIFNLFTSLLHLSGFLNGQE